MKTLLIPAFMIVSLSTGCASITSGQTQPISLETRNTQGKQISGATCKLINDKGTYFVTSPGTVIIQRSYNDLAVNCSKDGDEPGIATAKSSTKAMAFGNIIFGGIIGGAIDASTGAAYDYPSLLTIIMGQFTTLDSKPAATVDATQTAAK